MRILQLCHGLPPESVGGVEQHVDGLARALAAQGHDVHVFARSSDHDRAQGALFAQREGNPRITRAVYRWEGVRDLAGTYTCEPMAATLRAFLQAEQRAGRGFDVAHVHHLTGMSTDAVAVLREHGLPVVLTLHDYWLMCPRGQMWHRREEYCAQVEPGRCGECLHLTFGHWVSRERGPAVAAEVHERARATIGLATRLVVPSPRVIAPFQALGIPPERFTVVGNGVDTGALDAVAAPACGPGPLRLGYLGTLLPSKGLHVLLAALARLPAGTATLAIHGNAVPYHGDESFLLRCFQALRTDAGVHYHGPYSGSELPRILDAIDVLCAPALWAEAFGLTVREAQAAGRPVLVSAIGGLQDAIVDGREGFVLPPGDVGAWAAAIARLAADRPLARRMAAQARPRARGFQAMAADLVAVYADSVRSTA
jgi:glycosyltransferase involved in cell wall biosynthesis